MTKNNKCPVCNQSKISRNINATDFHGTKKLSKDKFIYKQCQNCEAIYLTGVTANKSYYKKYYKDEYYDNNGVKSLLSDFITKIANYFKLNIVENYTSENNKKILDIGAGELKFLKVMDDSYEKSALDIHKPKIEIDDITYIESDVFSHKFREKYDLITMWHFLEHAEKPTKLFKKLSKVIKDDGTIIFSMPNIDSLGFKLASENWFHFDAPRHITLYSKKTVKELANQSGFELVRSYNLWYEFPTDLFWSVRDHKYRHLIIFLYPIMKFISNETTCYVFKKI